MKEMEVLSKGSHLENGHACVMEAAAYIAGEKWSDEPECVSPVIRAFMVNWNDSIADDETRTRLIAPLITDILGTRGSEESEFTRSWMAFDWLVRECGPGFMDLTDSLKPHAKALRDLGPIYDSPTLAAASPTIEAAHKASDAAWDAARDALAPTVLALQASAVDLVRRMAEIERVESKPVRALRINGFEFAP